MYEVFGWPGRQTRRLTESAAGQNSRRMPTKLKERMYVHIEYKLIRRFNSGFADSEGRHTIFEYDELYIVYTDLSDARRLYS